MSGEWNEPPPLYDPPTDYSLWRRVPGSLKGAIVALVVGGFVSLDFTSQSTRNGVVVQCSYIGFGAIIGGLVAAVLGARVALEYRAARRTPGPYQSHSWPTALAGAVVAILGIALVASGLGLYGGPCN